MKTWMKVVLGIVAGISVLLGVIFWLTSDVTKAGDDFFAAVQNDDIDAAYALLSDDFKAGTSKADLKTYIAANAFDKIKDASWGGRMMTGGVAELEGTITTEGGSKIPIKLRLIDSESGWRINAIEKDIAGFKTAGSDRGLPSVDKQKQLFRETMTVFAESLSEGTMKKLRDNGAGAFQRQITLEDLDKAYEGAFKYAGDFSEIAKSPPTIDSADFREDGALLIRGHYPIKPRPVYIEQSYEYEGVGWKFLGLVYRVGAPVGS
ncbi:hypothetical protein GCM10009096_05520 [Parasphingorhabdus litoris]|uniref:DUF4864 domain-containing protein n=1 Tax=Parasphingorhabdus litoris TaxID=394733 RepID=A0ABN1A4W9_9SPHN|nr:hypothetical protein [Parasphingorhabdus litoris]